MSNKSRAEVVNDKSPDLIADVTLYSTIESGMHVAITPGIGLLCFSDKNKEQPGWIAYMQLGEREFAPGQTRTVGFCFLSGEKAAAVMRRASTFYLYREDFLGEARIKAE